MVNARVLKFHMHIPHEKLVDPYFFFMSELRPFSELCRLKTKFENLVCKISQKVLKLEPSYLVHLLELRSK